MVIMQKNYYLFPFSFIKKYLDNLAKKWNWGIWDFIVIFCVFSATGMSVTLLREPVQKFIWGSSKGKFYYVGSAILFIVLYYIILIILGSLAGKSKFFLSMSTRPLKRVKFLFFFLLYLFRGLKRLFFHGKLDAFHWKNFSRNSQKNKEKE